MLKKGDHTVYGIHGLCRVEDIQVPPFIERGKERDFYVMVADADERGLLYVPVDSEAERLRNVTDEDTAKELIREPADKENLNLCGGKKSEPIVSAIIKRNEAREMMSLVKTLYILRMRREEEGKKFAAVDEKHLMTAEKLLFGELAYSLSCDADDVRRQVQEVVSSR
ncbi:MAG: CarD family transcriptional regulator, partial [Lachnospiraceae bacterium]|nr:CarD family transcriptional regulator [Lachnospiraceae bacterium]